MKLKKKIRGREIRFEVELRGGIGKLCFVMSHKQNDS